MKLNYKDTLQYEEDEKAFKSMLGLSIGFFSIFFLIFIGIFFFLKNDSLEIALVASLSGMSLYLLADTPLIISTISLKKDMNFISQYMDEVYVFKFQVGCPCVHFRCQNKYYISFKYRGELKTLTTSWIYDSNNLDNSLVELGYIEKLDKIIVIKKIA